jgi:hypothetical protein
LLEDCDDETALRDQVRRLLELNAGTLRYLAAARGSLSGAEVERLVRGRKLGAATPNYPAPQRRP